jgi:hypothetical protein
MITAAGLALLHSLENVTESRDELPLLQHELNPEDATEPSGTAHFGPGFFQRRFGS